MTTLEVKSISPDTVISNGLTSRTPNTPQRPAVGPTNPSRVFTLVFALIVISILIYGWSVRGNEYLIAESGTGYMLGIIGGSMMLLLLSYSLRKKLAFMQHWGALKYWFRFHMLMGVLGPVLILFHANFGLGSLNSNVALFSMLLVAASGLIGRVIYARIHFGLYGKKATVVEFRQLLAEDEEKLGKYVQLPQDTLQRLHRLYDVALTPHNWLVRIWMLATFSLRTRWAFFLAMRDIRQAIKTTARTKDWDAAVRRKLLSFMRYNLRKYLREIVKVAHLSTYGHLFSLWHVIHIPLFFMMLVSGIVHVIAVHMY